MKKMSIEIHILQKLANGVGSYFIGHRRTSNGRETRFSAWLISPTVPYTLQNKQLGSMPFDDVDAFAKSQTLANIAFGKSVGPFQWGIAHGEFVFVEEVTCDAMELVMRCYSEEISDYAEVARMMKSLTIPATVTETINPAPETGETK